MHTVSQQTGDRLVARMQKENGFSDDAAKAVLHETLVFLNMIAENPGCPSSPSPIVDIGWHTFILYTREYAEFCERAAGEFIHHSPTDTPELKALATTSQSTVEFMEANGIVFDPVLWGKVAFCDSRGGGGNDGKCSRSLTKAQTHGTCTGCTSDCSCSPEIAMAKIACDSAPPTDRCNTCTPDSPITDSTPAFDFGHLLGYHDATIRDLVSVGGNMSDCDDGRGNCKSCGGGLGKCS